MSDNDDFDARLDKALKAKEEKQRQSESPSSAVNGKDLSQAFRVIAELVLSIGLCAGAGYWLDTVLGTIPLFLLIGVILGLIAGFMTVYKLSNNMGYAVGYAPLHKQNKEQADQNDEVEKS